MRPYKKRIKQADCWTNKHAWVVSGAVSGVDDEGDVHMTRVCLACREERAYSISRHLFMGIQTEHLWMAPDVRLGV